MHRQDIEGPIYRCIRRNIERLVTILEYKST
jgi:hypothetical protein